MPMNYKMLLSPFQIGKVKLKNRIVQPPQGQGTCAEDGSVTQRMIDYYEARAKGGVGMSHIESFCFDYPLGATSMLRPRIDDDKYIAGLRQLTDTMHSYGTPVCLQFVHAGPAHIQKKSGLQPIAASSLTPEEHPMTSDYPPATRYGMPRGMTIPEIEEMVGKWATAAERAKRAGFDGVHLHFCHAYLVNSFLSRAWNRRTDRYGCESLENRARFGVEIIQETRKRVGPDFLIGVRLNGREWNMKDGTTVGESQEFAKRLEAAGASYLEISSWGVGRWSFVTFPEQMLFPEPVESPVDLQKMVRKPGLQILAAQEIKKVVSIPIMGVGRMNPDLGEWLLRQGKVDLIVMGRRLMADPELPNKLAAGRAEDVAPCTACLECWGSRDVIHEDSAPRQCRINASLHREVEYAIKPVEKKKKVLVVGGGPAGMEAARVAALRGHDVSLYVKDNMLGGLLPLAALVKGTEVENIPAIVRYLSRQMIRLKVKVRLGKEVDLHVVEKLHPDAVIIATGGVPVVPEIPGIFRKNVVSVERLHSLARTGLMFFSPGFLRWLTKIWMPVGKRVVILGGSIIGCELAEFFVKRGRQVTILETSDKLGAEMVEQNKGILLDWLDKKGVVMLAGVKVEKITSKGVDIVTREGEQKTIAADSVLPAMFPAADTGLFEALSARGYEAYMVGSCREPNLILEAIHDGSRVGHMV